MKQSLNYIQLILNEAESTALYKSWLLWWPFLIKKVLQIDILSLAQSIT